MWFIWVERGVMRVMDAWTRGSLVIAMVAMVATTATWAAAQPPDAGGEWPSYGGTNWSQKYSPLDQIDRSNFETLSIAWIWESADIALIESLQRRYLPPLDANGLKATPLVVNGGMYLSTGLAQVVALDPTTGETLWVHDPRAYTTGGNASIVGPWQTRGLAYWTDGADDERLLLGTHDGFLIAATHEIVRRQGRGLGHSDGFEGEVSIADDVFGHSPLLT